MAAPPPLPVSARTHARTYRVYIATATATATPLRIRNMTVHTVPATCRAARIVNPGPDVSVVLVECWRGPAARERHVRPAPHHRSVLDAPLTPTRSSSSSWTRPSPRPKRGRDKSSSRSRLPACASPTFVSRLFLVLVYVCGAVSPRHIPTRRTLQSASASSVTFGRGNL